MLQNLHNIFNRILIRTEKKEKSEKEAFFILKIDELVNLLILLIY